MKIVRGACAGLTGIVQSNVHQPTVDDPERWASGYRIVLDNGEMTVVRWEWVEIQGDNARTENRETLSGSTFAKPL